MVCSDRRVSSGRAATQQARVGYSKHYAGVEARSDWRKLSCKHAHIIGGDDLDFNEVEGEGYEEQEEYFDDTENYDEYY